MRFDELGISFYRSWWHSIGLAHLDAVFYPVAAFGGSNELEKYHLRGNATVLLLIILSSFSYIYKTTRRALVYYYFSLFDKILKFHEQIT